MTIKTSLTLAALCHCLLVAPASAEDERGFYLQLKAASSHVDSNERFDTSGTGSQRETIDIGGGNGLFGSLGYQTESFRFELEYLSLDSEFEGDAAIRAGGDKLDLSGAFLSLWYMTPKIFNDRVQPYLGGGLGRLTLETEVEDENKNAMMVGGGFDIQIFDQLEIGLGIRYLPSSRYTELDPGQATSPILGGNNSDNFVVEYRAIVTCLGIKFSFF